MDIANVVGILSTLCAEESIKYRIEGVAVETGDDQFRLIATDARMLGVVSKTHPNTPTGFQAAATENYNTDPVVIPPEDWKFAFGDPKASRRDPRKVSIEVSDGRLEISSGHWHSNVAPLDGRFPKWREVVPKGDPVFEISLKPELLIKLLKVAQALMSEDSTGIQFRFFDKDKPVHLFAKGERGGMVFDGLLMPVEFRA